MLHFVQHDIKGRALLHKDGDRFTRNDNLEDLKTGEH